MTSRLRVLWLCKTRYMNHDVIDDRYARLFELPNSLGKRQAVSSFCLDYRLAKAAPVSDDLTGSWRRSSIPRTFFIGWFFVLLAYARQVRPQCVIASSDCLHIILGDLVSRLFGARFYADLYDDYSTFGLAKIPGMRWLYRRALARANGICAVSRTLGRDIEKQYPDKPVVVLESTIDAALFRPQDRVESRKMLGLDRFEGKKLVGVCGGLNAFHGADIVFNAFAKIAAQDPHVVFVVAGKLYNECPLPEREDVAYLGMLPHSQMSYFFSALDVAVVALSNTRFGYYAFPQKAYELLACRVPVAAADVGALGMLFGSLKEALYDPDSSVALADTVLHQLEKKSLLDVRIPTWSEQAEKMDNFILEEVAAAN
jgi:teichuronic acid biosynthesis glycosyltransferase TuaC